MKVLKEFCLLFIGVLIGVIAGSLLKDENVNTLITIILILFVIYFSDETVLFLLKIIRKINNHRGAIALLAPHEIDSETASWVNISLRQITREIKKVTKKVSKISSYKFMDIYPIVMNPYGGVYIENKLEETPNFNKILSYVKNGGIFVNIADIPFYYAYSVDLKRRIDMTPVAGPFDRIRSFFESLVTKKLFIEVYNSESLKTTYKNIEVKRTFLLGDSIINLCEQSTLLTVHNGYAINQDQKIVPTTNTVPTSPFICVPYGSGYFVFATLSLTSESKFFVGEIIGSALKMHFRN